jgi:hypothetical protein
VELDHPNASAHHAGELVHSDARRERIRGERACGCSPTWSSHGVRRARITTGCTSKSAGTRAGNGTNGCSANRCWRRAAFRLAKWCWLYSINARWLSDRQLENVTAHGLTTHAQVNGVFKGGDHWDPGEAFPKDLFLKWVKEEFAYIEGERSDRVAVI